MIGHRVGALETERFTSCRATYTQFFDDSLILSTAQELKFNYSFPACTNHVRLGMTGFIYAAAAALTPASSCLLLYSQVDQLRLRKAWILGTSERCHMNQNSMHSKSGVEDAWLALVNLLLYGDQH
jgi:hypothetical protein